MYLSFYRGVDQFSNNGKTSDVIGFFDAESQLYTYFRYDQSYAEGLDWGNRVGALRWNHLFNENELRNFVNVYLNDEDIRYLDEKIDTSLNDGDSLAIIPSIAGGI